MEKFFNLRRYISLRKPRTLIYSANKFEWDVRSAKTGGKEKTLKFSLMSFFWQLISSREKVVRNNNHLNVKPFFWLNIHVRFLLQPATYRSKKEGESSSAWVLHCYVFKYPFVLLGKANLVICIPNEDLSPCLPVSTLLSYDFRVGSTQSTADCEILMSWLILKRKFETRRCTRLYYS